MDNIKKFRIIKFKSKPILTAKSISKSFEKRMILRKIDIHLNQGEMLGLLGSNGAGKSTFMNIVLGLLKPDFGEDVYDEEENQRDVTFRWYGRVEGSMYINMDYTSYAEFINVSSLKQKCKVVTYKRI